MEGAVPEHGPVEALALDGLHDQEVAARVVAVVEDLDHVRRVEGGQDATLAEEAGHGGPVVGEARGEDLERDRELVFPTHRLVDRAHPAAPVFPDDAILVEEILGRPGQGPLGPNLGVVLGAEGRALEGAAPAALDLGQLGLRLLAKELPLAEEDRDLGQELCGPIGLDEVVVGAGFEASHDVLLLAQDRDQHDGQLALVVALAQLTGQLEPVHPGHLNVRDHEVGGVVEDLLEGVLPVGVLAELKALVAEQARGEAPHHLAVFDQSDSICHRAHATRSVGPSLPPGGPPSSPPLWTLRSLL